MNDVLLSPGSLFTPMLSWMNIHWHDQFDATATFFNLLIDGIVQLLSIGPAWAVIGALTVVSLLLAGWRGALLCLAGLATCVLLGMWTTTVQTLALIVIAVVFSVLVGVPLGIFFSRSRRLQNTARPLLDVMQTLPPWVYLVPVVVLFGLGTVPALLSTIIYGIAPMVRLTILAMSQIPKERIELGHAIGASKLQVLFKIQLPSALPTLLLGVNQCILLSLAMVVLAGLVGAGGLGAEVTRGLSRMEFGLGLRASVAIVILAIVMDRIFRGAMPKSYLT